MYSFDPGTNSNLNVFGNNFNFNLFRQIFLILWFFFSIRIEVNDHYLQLFFCHITHNC